MPLLESRIGRSVTMKMPDGRLVSGEIIDEIVRVQSDYPDKQLHAQLIVFEDGRREVRLGYYIKGVKPGRRGQWVWGQYCPSMPVEDFKALTEAVEKKGWLADTVAPGEIQSR